LQLIKITSTNQSTTASVVTENHDSEDAHTLDSIVIREIGNLSLSRILKVTKARIVYVMISVTSVLMILYVILQQRKTLLKQRWEVMLRMFV